MSSDYVPSSKGKLEQSPNKHKKLVKLLLSLQLALLELSILETIENISK